MRDTGYDFDDHRRSRRNLSPLAFIRRKPVQRDYSWLMAVRRGSPFWSSAGSVDGSRQGEVLAGTAFRAERQEVYPLGKRTFVPFREQRSSRLAGISSTPKLRRYALTLGPRGQALIAGEAAARAVVSKGWASRRPGKGWECLSLNVGKGVDFSPSALRRPGGRVGIRPRQGQADSALLHFTHSNDVPIILCPACV